MKAIYPGSFDPITNGHLDVIRQASALFDELIVAVGINYKKSGLFTPAHREVLISESIESELCCGEVVTTECFDGLVVDFAAQVGAEVLVRGLRSVTDFEFEFQFATACRSMCPELKIAYFMTDAKHLFVSSSLVKEIAEKAANDTLHHRLCRMVPPPVMKALAEHLRCGNY